jgi:carbamoyltransferase
MYILGISCFYHDAAAAIIKDGRLIAAAQEERFTREKHDPSFPKNAIKFCLDAAKIKVRSLDYVGFYEKPFLKFDRLLQTYLDTSPKGLFSFLEAMPIWLKEKLWIKNIIKNELNWSGDIIFATHHLAHAASSFLASPFEKAAILTMDGVGEWETTTLGWGEKNDIVLAKAIHFPHSLGLLYSAFTYYCGFKVNSGEYKLMGLAPNGKPKYVKKIYDNIVNVKKDGSFALNMDYFTYEYGLRMIGKKFENLFGAPPLSPEKLPHPEFYCDMAASIQRVTEEIILRMVKYLYNETKQENLCLAGGVALNCVANGRIIRETPFKKLYIQPAAGDAGGAIGTVFYIYNTLLGNKRKFVMDHAYWGPSFSNEEIKKFLDKNKIAYKEIKDDTKLFKTVASLINEQKIIGWFNGKMEWGPRALGARSILADPRSPKMKDILNLKIKHREPFRPFAPTVMEEKINDWFELDQPTPFMLLVAPVKKRKQKIPAVTHVDNSARIQSVSKKQNPCYWRLINEFYKLTGCPVVVNTSFNIRGEPIVCTPQDAYNCFMGTEMDYLVLENFLVNKKQMKVTQVHKKFKDKFKPD